MAADTVPPAAPAVGPETILAAMTRDEKVALLIGIDLWRTCPVPRLGLRSVVMADGPAGIRRHDDAPSASFPAPSALGATWDVGLAARVGEAFAAEARRHDVDVVLAPQVNLQRTPVGGRHFECYSEDPILTAALAVPLVTAAQARGVGMCVKHYVANDSETERTDYVARVDERTLREVYLAPFEALVAAGAWSVMGAYNGVDDGVESAPVLEHRRLLTGVLKDEWGFDGVVVSDWVATKSVVGPVRAGMDLQMPGPDGPWGDGLAAAVAAGQVSEHELDDKVLRVLRLAQRVGALGEPAAAVTGVDVPAVLRELAARSLVVLKDEAGLLPLDAPASIALVGPNAVTPFLAGGGSSSVRPDRRVPLEAAMARAFPGAHVALHAGAVSRFTAAPLDLAAATTPAGKPGVHAQLLDEAGTVLREWVADEWDEDVADLPEEAASLRLRTRAPLATPGVHAVGVATIGRHRILIDGLEVSASDREVCEDVVLDSTYNHPAAVMVPVVGPGVVEIDATVQVAHPVGYEDFLRLRMLHDEPGPTPAELREEAVAAAAAADVAVVVVGTTEEVESEGWDRTGLDLPGDQDELVRAVLAVQPRTIVVVNAGAPVLLPWLDDAPCVVWGWLGGQEWADAVADAFSGAVEPSGRLPWTLPARAADVPVPDAVPVDGIVEYIDRIDVGYRGWDRLGRTPAAPFGHGLGWTTWDYQYVKVATDVDGNVTAAVTLANTGHRAGREVVQVYLEPPQSTSTAERPVRWLAGFAVIDAEPGARVTAHVTLHPYAWRSWAPGAGWTTPPGAYRVRIGRSSRDIRVTTYHTVRAAASADPEPTRVRARAEVTELRARAPRAGSGDALRVGLVGAGPAAQAIHLPTLARLDGRVRVTEVMDVDGELARVVAAPHGARATTSLGEMLSGAGLDIAVIGSPNAVHVEQIEALCAAGVAGILAEKPLATTRDEAERVATAVGRSGTALVVGAMHGYDPAWLAAREALAEAGDPGPFHVRCAVHIPANERFEDMATTMVRPPRHGAGPAAPAAVVRGGVLGLAIHDLPLIRTVIPRLDTVRFATHLAPWGYGITATGPGGSVDLLARVGGTWQPDWTLSVWGQDTELELSFPPSYVHAGSATAWMRRNGVRQCFGPFPEDGYDAEWSELLSVLGGRAPRYGVAHLVADLEYAIELADLAEAALGVEAVVSR